MVNIPEDGAQQGGAGRAHVAGHGEPDLEDESLEEDDMIIIVVKIIIIVKTIIILNLPSRMSVLRAATVPALKGMEAVTMK